MKTFLTINNSFLMNTKFGIIKGFKSRIAGQTLHLNSGLNFHVMTRKSGFWFLKSADMSLNFLDLFSFLNEPQVILQSSSPIQSMDTKVKTS